MHFHFSSLTISLGILVISSPAAIIATDGILDEGLEETCFGLGCQRRWGSAPAEYNFSVPCSEEDIGEVFPNKEDCHSFYYCTVNRTALKLNCPPEYGFEEDYQRCIPEYRVKACNVVICPPYIFDGVVPDKKNCRAYYRCIYGFVYHYRCPEGSVFDYNRGICRPYTIGNEPECLSGPVSTTPIPTTTTTTPLPPTSSVTPVTETTATTIVTTEAPVTETTTTAVTSTEVPSTAEPSTTTQESTTVGTTPEQVTSSETPVPTTSSSTASSSTSEPASTETAVTGTGATSEQMPISTTTEAQTSSSVTETSTAASTPQPA